MNTFMSVHQDKLLGKLTMFDRIIFKGHLCGLFVPGSFARFMWAQGFPLKDFKRYVQQVTQQVKARAQQVAQEAGRPFLYLATNRTRARGSSKEELARAIAERDQVTAGLICVLSAVEPCTSFELRSNSRTHKLEVVPRVRKCLHFYFYFLDPEFGLMHLRLQSWFPLELQVYLNGHEWLARQLRAQGIDHACYDNCLTQVADLATAQALADRFAHRQWPRVLDAFAQLVNPLFPTLRDSPCGAYYWVIDQCEVSTDLLFPDRATLVPLVADLVEAATLDFSCEDVLRFLGRKLHGNLQGQVTSSMKKRPEGRRVKHQMKRNSIKLYDKASVLRIEVTINNPREFKVLRVHRHPEGRQRRWEPMGKGVANFWRFYQVSRQASDRYLEALAQVEQKGEAVQELDNLCRSRMKDGKRYARFSPVTKADSTLFAAVLAGGHVLNGFRNHDLCTHLYAHPPVSPTESKRRCARVSRIIAKLRGHGLVMKVKDARLYRVTPYGYRIMAAAISFRRQDFPRVFQQAA
jgi:hypothetical protein